MPQTKNINITPGQMPTQVIHVSQNDVGREIILNIKDAEGWYDLTGCTVSLAGLKPSGLGYTVAGTVSGHQVTIVTTKQMTDEYGSIASELKIASGNNIIGTANIILAVERDPHPDHTTDGSVDTLIPEITILVERVEAAVAKAEVLQESEAWAVGTRDGAPVDEEDPVYHNNSKYYAEQAGTHEANAAESMTNAEESEIASAASASNANYQRAAAEEARNRALSAQAAAEQAAQDAASAFSVIGNVAFTVLPNGQVREIWTEEE